METLTYIIDNTDAGDHDKEIDAIMKRMLPGLIDAFFDLLEAKEDAIKAPVKLIGAAAFQSLKDQVARCEQALAAREAELASAKAEAEDAAREMDLDREALEATGTAGMVRAVVATLLWGGWGCTLPRQGPQGQGGGPVLYSPHARAPCEALCVGLPDDRAVERERESRVARVGMRLRWPFLICSPALPLVLLLLAASAETFYLPCYYIPEFVISPPSMPPAPPPSPCHQNS